MISIEELHLSGRCRNALRRAGITSLERLENAFITGKLKYLPRVGIGCISEVKRELERSRSGYGLHLPRIKLPHIKIKVVWR